MHRACDHRAPACCVSGVRGVEAFACGEPFHHGALLRWMANASLVGPSALDESSSAQCAAPDARSVALKPGCEKVKGWFTDAACTVPFADGTAGGRGCDVGPVRAQCRRSPLRIDGDVRGNCSRRDGASPRSSLKPRWTANPCCRLFKKSYTGRSCRFHHVPAYRYEAEGRAREAVWASSARMPTHRQPSLRRRS